MNHQFILTAATAWLLSTLLLPAEVRVVAERNPAAEANPLFQFKTVPRPARNDAAATARISLVEGRRDANGGDVTSLNDGRVPFDEDMPSANFFFTAGTDGGRLLLELKGALEIRQINTYSWHANTRGPQVFKLYASDGKSAGFNARPARGTAPETCGWQLMATVDTRPATEPPGGQYGVSISAATGCLGPYQYLLFDASRTEDRDSFGNTFFSEIDVLECHAPPPELADGPSTQVIRETVEIAGGKYRAVIDTSKTPDLTEWTRQAIVPMVQEWYPKMVALLPSEGFEAPASFSIGFDADMQGVAATGGTRIRCAAGWMRRNLQGEAVGAIFHEMVHVVQQYGRAPRRVGSSRAPGWLTEGITDYLRFFIFEPQTRGAEISRRNFERARFDGSYRVTGNFLHWVSAQHGQDFVPKLNAIIREGKYNEDAWKTLTGRTVEELGEAWKADLARKLGIEPANADAPPGR